MGLLLRFLFANGEMAGIGGDVVWERREPERFSLALDGIRRDNRGHSRLLCRRVEVEGPGGCMQFATLCVVVLLPMVPALILFKALPESKGDVSGTLHGLDVKLKGGFAGYFAMVLLILVFHKSLFPAMAAPVAPFQVWYVTGHVTDANGGAVTPLQDTDVRVSPASFSESTPGMFTLTAFSSPDPGGGTDSIYPTLYIGPSPDKYLPLTEVSLDPSKQPAAGDDWTMTTTGHQIHLEIKMKGVTPYPEGLTVMR